MWQQATIEITLLLLVCTSYVYGCYSRAHPVRGESHIQCNVNQEVATVSLLCLILLFAILQVSLYFSLLCV